MTAPPLLVLFMTSSIGFSAAECDIILEDYRAEALQLDYQEFDQTQGSGFRWLAEQGCTSQAADLIEEYIEANNSTQRSLIWHVAQLRGESGNTNAALQAARQSLDPMEASDALFRWNAHVRAYIAILEQDRDAFHQNLEELKASKDEHRGNGMNASMWENIEPYFDLGYADALRAAYGKQTEEDEKL